jgi:spore coat polysaccharide biosynthesis protein SpsF
MGSTRLPHKVLADIAGRSLISRVLERVRAASTLDDLVVATTLEAADDTLVELIRKTEDCRVFRGSRDDVLDRYYRAAELARADVIVRVTADDPLKDPGVIDRAVSEFRADPLLDYCSNTLQPTFPEGLDIEVFGRSALDESWREARLPSEREHVTPYIWSRPGKFRLRNFSHTENLSEWRWTVDKAEDLTFMRAVFHEFHERPLVPYTELIDWLKRHPEIRALNAGTVRNEGYFESLRKEHGND